MDTSSVQGVSGGRDLPARYRRRVYLGKEDDVIVVKVECECGRTLGRLVGSREGELGRFAGIQKPTRTVTTSRGDYEIAPTTVYGSGNTTGLGPAVGVDDLIAIGAASNGRQTVRCARCSRPGRPHRRTYRWDTLAERFSAAVRSGRRVLTLDVDL